MTICTPVLQLLPLPRFPFFSCFFFKKSRILFLNPLHHHHHRHHHHHHHHHHHRLVLFFIYLLIKIRCGTYVQAAGLVVGAVRARHKLTELALRREPRLQVQLLRRRQVQGAGHNVHNLVGQPNLKAREATAETKAQNDVKIGLKSM